MAADVELPPLPEPECMGGNDVYGVEYPLYTSDHMQSYARTCVAHATAAKDAEIEALRAEVAKLQALRKHHRARHKSYKRRHADAIARAERLAEALRLWKQGEESGDYLTQVAAIKARDAALHPTAAQEAGRE